MSNVQPSQFPTMDEIMQLVRSIVNDTFPNIAGTQGRIFTNDAQFTLPYFNSALRKVQRKLRNEGVTFPIKDGVILNNVPPVVAANASVFINIGYTGTYNGTTTSAQPFLPGDFMQPYLVRVRPTGSTLQFVPVPQARQALPSALQNATIGNWEWRGYSLYFNGSLQAQDVMLRYLSGQPPVNAQATDFDITIINIIDCQDAIANYMAEMYARARGGNPQSIKDVQAAADEAVDAMAEEYIRRAQTINYQRQSYQGGGSDDGRYTDVQTGTGI